MEASARSKLHLAASKDEAIAALREALPKDAIVRDEDDGIGRFAGERTVMIIGEGRDQLKLYQGNWRLVKAKDDEPQLRVKFKTKGERLTVRLQRGAIEQPGPGAVLMGLITNVVTVIVVVVAYHMFREIPIDKNQVGAIGIGGGVVWTAIARFWPKKPAAGLDDMVLAALAPLEEDAKADAEGKS
jgi:hypothetical protein